jgi:hypothetical protein
MSAKEILAVGIKTIVVAIGLTIIFMIAAVVSGIGRHPPAAAVTPSANSTQREAVTPPAIAAQPSTAGKATPSRQPANALLWLFVASLVQVVVISYLVLQAKWGGWRLVGALFLLVLNTWVQAALESLPYLQARVSPQFSAQALVTGLVTAALFAPFAVWVLGGSRRAPRTEQAATSHRSFGRWTGALAATTVIFVVLYYLCGYYIAWQNPELRQYYAGSTAIRSFWGQMTSIWTSTPWMFAFQAGRGLLFVAMTLPVVRMLRGGALRVAFGTALMYAIWDGSAGLIIPNPIFPPSVAHSHMIELAVWGLLFGAFVGWLMRSDRAATAPAGL